MIDLILTDAAALTTAIDERLSQADITQCLSVFSSKDVDNRLLFPHGEFKISEKNPLHSNLSAGTIPKLFSQSRPNMLLSFLPRPDREELLQEATKWLCDRLEPRNPLTILRGVSGCGKTRAILEAGIFHFSLYLCARNRPPIEGQDFDSGECPEFADFARLLVEELVTINKNNHYPESGNLFNRAPAKKLILTLLISRIKLLQFIQKTHPTLTPLQWLLFQWHGQFLGRLPGNNENIFNMLFTMVYELVKGLKYPDLRKIIMEEGFTNKTLTMIAFDEIVSWDKLIVSSKLMPGLSRTAQAEGLGLVSPLGDAIHDIESLGFSFVLSGTGLSLTLLEAPFVGAAVKVGVPSLYAYVLPETKFPRIKDRDDVDNWWGSSGTTRRLFNTTLDKHIGDLVFNHLRGRLGTFLEFQATLVSVPESAAKLNDFVLKGLNEFWIYITSNSKAESPLRSYRWMLTQWWKLQRPATGKPDPVDLLSRLVVGYLLHGDKAYLAFDTETISFVDSSICYLDRGDESSVFVGEPAMIEAAAQFLTEKQKSLPFAFLRLMEWPGISGGSSRGYLFEKVLPHILCSAFKKAPLSEHPLFAFATPENSPWFKDLVLAPTDSSSVLECESLLDSLNDQTLSSSFLLPEFSAGPGLACWLTTKSSSSKPQAPPTSDSVLLLLQSKLYQERVPRATALAAHATTDPQEVYKGSQTKHEEWLQFCKKNGVFARVVRILILLPDVRAGIRYLPCWNSENEVVAVWDFSTLRPHLPTYLPIAEVLEQFFNDQVEGRRRAALPPLPPASPIIVDPSSNLNSQHTVADPSVTGSAVDPLHAHEEPSPSPFKRSRRSRQAPTQS